MNQCWPDINWLNILETYSKIFTLSFDINIHTPVRRYDSDPRGAEWTVPPAMHLVQLLSQKLGKE